MEIKNWVLKKFKDGKTDKLNQTFLIKSIMSKFNMTSEDASFQLSALILPNGNFSFYFDEARDTAYVLLGSTTHSNLINQLDKLKKSLKNSKNTNNVEIGDEVRIISGKYAGVEGELDDLGSEGYGSAIVISDAGILSVRSSQLVRV